MANSIASRVTELKYLPVYGKVPTARGFFEVHMRLQLLIPVDICADAMNLFELICFSKALQNDRHHRVGILALREDRLTRRIRNIIHSPTTVMLADQLTKQERSIRLRRGVKRPATYSEQDLGDNQYETAYNDPGESLELNEDMISLLEFVSFCDGGY
eukprot:3989277-Pyramimonas_sp.AAC.1